MNNDLAAAFNNLACAIKEQRDDLFNQAMLTRPETFSAMAPLLGTRTVTIAQMPPQAGAVSYEAYRNTGNLPVVAYVRAKPNLSTTPPNPITVENVLLLVSVNESAADLAKATVCDASQGKIVAVLVRPNEVLNISAVASSDTEVSWRVLPLRGRTAIFRE